MQWPAAQGNPSSLHTPGREARRLLEEARSTVARELSTEPQTVIFTSGATESDNLAVLGTARAAKQRGRHLIASYVEHSAVLGPIQQLLREGFEVTGLEVDATGRVDPQAVARAMRPDTVLVSVMLANNELGTVQPIRAIREAIGPEVLFHTDAAQACGKLKLDLEELGVDLLTLSGHKMHGPRGVGALCLRSRVEIESLFFGGSHERGIRSGTENVAAALGFAKALEIAHRDLDRNLAHMEKLREILLVGLSKQLPGLLIHGSEEYRIPSILSLSVPGTEGIRLVLDLDRHGISISSGSACSSQSLDTSHVMEQIGLDLDTARAAIRVSVAADTLEDEIHYAVETIPRVIEDYRKERQAS